MIIGLSGYAQSGKDTVAKVLVEKYGYRRVAFADPIRDLLYGMDPLVPKGYGESVINYRLQDLVDSYGWEKWKMGIVNE
jgi:dephospho-CoA kinase